MAIFLDTGFYFALLAKKDKNHTRSENLLKLLIEHNFGRVYTSDYVLNESMTLINVRTHGIRPDLLKKMASYFLGSYAIANLIKVDPMYYEEIITLQKKITKANDPVSFTDASNLILCKNLGITNIITFDDHYKGYLNIIN